MAPPACAIVVTFHPDGGFRDRFRRTAEQVPCVIVVDNGSGPTVRAILEELTAEHDHVLIPNGTNLGVAHALNQGAQAALDRGYRWAVTLDQDSTPEPGMVHALRASLAAQRDPDAVAMIGPDIVQADVGGQARPWLRRHPRIPGLFQRTTCADGAPGIVTMAITSGALTNLDAWRRMGGFWDALFIDYVDTEYCLRAARHGLRTIACCEARLRHRLGEKRLVRRFGIAWRPTSHGPDRLRYIARNRVHVAKRHAFHAPHWLAFDVMALGFNLVRILIAETDRPAKVAAMARGTVDGIRGLVGPLPAREEGRVAPAP